MSREYIGVDVGGTKIAVARLSGGELVGKTTADTDASGPDALIDELCAAVGDAVTGDVVAIGIGIPSVVEFAAGRARTSVNVPLEDVPLRELLGERLGLPVFVDNDATLAAFAEAHEGDELVTRDLVMFTVGTGVGGGLVLDGRPYRGATGAAGELGHTLIGVRVEAGAPEPDDFPQEGSLESLAAGSALDRLATEAVAEHPECYLGRLSAGGDERITGHDVVDGAREGDEVALELLTRLGERLGIGIANAINTFDPEVVAVGGGVSTAGDLLLEPARHTALQFVLPGVGERTEIRLSRHGPEGGVLGAALLARHELKRREEEDGDD